MANDCCPTLQLERQVRNKYQNHVSTDGQGIQLSVVITAYTHAV